MTSAERFDFLNVKSHSFQEDQSIEAYIEAIRDFIYIWRCINEDRPAFTFESVTEKVNREGSTIKKYYDKKAPVDDAAVDVDYCCG